MCIRDRALYGMRGANGVLLVTTKKGCVSAPQVSIRLQTGIQQPLGVPDPIKMCIRDSYCSSLGKYKVGIRSYSKWGINVHYKLHGLEATNNLLIMPKNTDNWSNTLLLFHCDSSPFAVLQKSMVL